MAKSSDISKGKQSMVKHGRLRSKVQESKAVGFKSLEASVHNKEVRIENWEQQLRTKV